MLVADSAKYKVFAARIARIAGVACFAPTRNALASTNRTAGPGVNDSTVSVAANSHHVVQLTTSSSQRGFTPVIVAYADGLGHVEYEDFAVADLTRARRVRQGFSHFIDPGRRHHHFKLHLRQQVHL